MFPVSKCGCVGKQSRLGRDAQPGADEDVVVPPEAAVAEELGVQPEEKEEQRYADEDPDGPDQVRAGVVVWEEGELGRC